MPGGGVIDVAISSISRCSFDLNIPYDIFRSIPRDMIVHNKWYKNEGWSQNVWQKVIFMTF